MFEVYNASLEVAADEPKAQGLEEHKTLYARLVDLRNGYQEALTLTDDQVVSSMFQEMIEMRSDHIAELDAILCRYGINS